MHERLKKYRNELGLTQEYVAKLLGIQRTEITAIESGDRKVTTEELKQFSRIYGVTTDEILNGYTSDLEGSRMFARLFSGLSENDKKEIMNLIEFKNRLKAGGL